MLTQGARAGSRPEQRQVQPGLQRSMGDVYQAVRLLVAANLSPKSEGGRLRENLCYCYLLQQPALTRIEDPTAVLRFAWRGKPGYRGKQIPHKGDFRLCVEKYAEPLIARIQLKLLSNSTASSSRCSLRLASSTMCMKILRRSGGSALSSGTMDSAIRTVAA